MIDTWTCNNIDASTTNCFSTSFSDLGSTSSLPFYVQDSGNISLALAIIIVLICLMAVGFMYNNMTSKKPWL